jgi:nitrate reductase NapAB chaperone NapD
VGEGAVQMLAIENEEEIDARLEHLENLPNALHRSLVFYDSTMRLT